MIPAVLKTKGNILSKQQVLSKYNIRLCSNPNYVGIDVSKLEYNLNDLDLQLHNTREKITSFLYTLKILILIPTV
jgi:hypothetical protein